MHVITGHILSIDGRVNMLLNELDGEFCKLYGIEEQIKQLAREFPESYHVAAFGGHDKSDSIDPHMNYASFTQSMQSSDACIRMQGLTEDQRR